MTVTLSNRSQHGGDHPLQVGVGRKEITPAKGIFLMGTIHCKREASIFKDPLYAKALCIQSGERRMLIISLDVTFITEKYIAEIRRYAVSNYGFNYEAIMVHATQNHGAPAIGYTKFSDDYPLPRSYEWLRGQQAEYHRFAMERIIEAIGLAVHSLQTVQCGVSSGIEGRVAFNRRMVMKDGTIGMPRGVLNNSCYLEGPIDPEVGVMCFKNDQSEMVSMLLNYTCHPVHELGPRGIVSADWPGKWSDQMALKQGNGCIPLVLNGACGNINPWDPFDPDYVDEDATRMGGILAETTERIIDKMTFADDAEIGWIVKTIQIPLREPKPEEVRKAQQYVEEKPVPDWIDRKNEIIDPEWVMQAQIIDVNNQRLQNPYYDYEIQVLRIGDAVYVGLPGELFVEGGLQIKLESPALFTYIVHATGNAGYIPFKEALDRGGHEAYYTNWSKLIPEAFELIVQETISLIHEIYK